MSNKVSLSKNLIVRSKSDGRGQVQVFKSNSKHPDTFLLNGLELAVTKRGQINIPKRIMQELGTRNKDGTYNILLNVGATHHDGELITGANIIKNARLSADIINKPTGYRISAQKIRDSILDDDTEILRPSEDIDIYS